MKFVDALDIRLIRVRARARLGVGCFFGCGLPCMVYVYFGCVVCFCM